MSRLGSVRGIPINSKRVSIGLAALGRTVEEVCVDTNKTTMAKIAAFVLVAINLYCVLSEPVVKLGDTSIHGLTLKSRGGREIKAFLGIHYAEAPVGDLRFRDPVPKTLPKGKLIAQQETEQCYQVILFTEIVVGTEDCLSVNVYVPNIQEKTLLPVMVWIHGGGYFEGNSSRRIAGPDYLLDKNIVLVTLEYRLGALGFLSTGDKAAPGNFGLKDQRLALKWVKENIGPFGGDPDKITLFGQSAGGTSISLHALQEESQKYFNRYIMESGTALYPGAAHPYPSYYEHAKALAKALNCTTDDSYAMVNCLRKIPGPKIVSTRLISLLQEIMVGYWGPTIEPPSETAFLTEKPIELLKNGKSKQGTVVAGVCRNEGLFAKPVLFADNDRYRAISSNPVSTIQFIMEHLQLPIKSKNLTAVAEKAKNFYIGDASKLSKVEFMQKFTNFVTDFLFFYPQKEYSNYIQNSGQPIYQYLFNYRGSLSFTLAATQKNVDLGISHSDDLIYLFPTNSHTIGTQVDIEQNFFDLEISELMVDLWTSFAINGAPTSEHLNGTVWPLHNREHQYLQIGNFSSTRTTLEHKFFIERIKFLDEIYNSH